MTDRAYKKQTNVQFTGNLIAGYGLGYSFEQSGSGVFLQKVLK